MGGCNGARILQSPEKDWPENAGTADTANLLSAIKAKYNAGRHSKRRSEEALC